MSYMKNLVMDILEDQIRQASEDVDRTAWEIRHAVANHVEAVRRLDAYRARKSGQVAADEIKAGREPF